MSEYTQKDADRFRKFGDEAEGVAFDWCLVNINGAGFTLLREPHHSDEQIKRAENKIRGNRDVIWLKVANIKEEKENG
jgi:hypothetical protein